jgi:hypothetical protein
MDNPSEPYSKSESEQPLYIELGESLPPQLQEEVFAQPTSTPAAENRVPQDSAFSLSRNETIPSESLPEIEEAPLSPILVVLRRTPPLKLIALVGSILVILLLFPQFLLILRGALLELLLLVRALMFPLAAVGVAILLLHLLYSRSR